MKKPILKLKTRIENNLIEIESYYDSIHLFLSQTKIVHDSNIGNSQIQQWLYDNRYTIAILEEILEKVEYKKSLIA